MEHKCASFSKQSIGPKKRRSCCVFCVIIILILLVLRIINLRENRRAKEEMTIQRHRQTWALKTHREDKRDKNIQHRKLKLWVIRTPPKKRGARLGEVVLVSYIVVYWMVICTCQVTNLELISWQRYGIGLKWIRK